IFDEALEVFGHPRRFHIGHDETRLRGRFPRDESCAQVPYPELFTRDVARLSDYLPKRGANVILWGDALLGHGEAPDAALAGSGPEARWARDGLPPGAAVTDWHYVDADAYPNLQALRADGR